MRIDIAVGLLRKPQDDLHTLFTDQVISTVIDE
jgi:hypothetical protein